MTCNCNVCGRENVQIKSVMSVDIVNEDGSITESIRSVVCFECTAKLVDKLKEIKDEYN